MEVSEMETRKKVIEQFNEYLVTGFNEWEMRGLFVSQTDKVNYVHELKLYLKDESVELPKMLDLVINTAIKFDKLDQFLNSYDINISNSSDLVNFLKELTNINDPDEMDDHIINYIIDNGLLSDFLEFENSDMTEFVGLSFDDYLCDFVGNNLIDSRDLVEMILDPDWAVSKFEALQRDLMFDYDEFLYDYYDQADILRELKLENDISFRLLDFLANEKCYQINLNYKLFKDYPYISAEINEYLNINNLYNYDSFADEFGYYAFQEIQADTIVYKKINTRLDNGNQVITGTEVIELLLKKGAMIGFNLTGSYNHANIDVPIGKCRASAAELTDQTKINLFNKLINRSYIPLKDIANINPDDYNFNIRHLEIYSSYDHSFVYNAGIVEPVSPFSFSPDECQSGIHFFFNKQDALEY